MTSAYPFTVIVLRGEPETSRAGTVDILWQPLVTLRARILEEKAGEGQTDHGGQPRREIVFRTRRYPVALSDRIAFREVAWNITEIEPVGRNDMRLRAVNTEEA